MQRQHENSALRLVRAGLLLRYTRYLEAVGAPVERLLTQSGIPSVLLDRPGAALRWECALRFLDLACRCIGSQHLSLQVALPLSWDGFGAYGEILQRAVTWHEYLRKGINAYNAVVTGQRIWLTDHGKDLRFHVANDGPPGVATYQAEMETLVTTLAMCKKAGGPGWAPTEIHLGYRTKEPLPEIELFDGARILRGTGDTCFTFPRKMLNRRFLSQSRPPITTSYPADPLPGDLPALVRLQIANLLGNRGYQIDAVAETLSTSRRSLQRRLAEHGLSYRQLLAQVRLQRAVDWLQDTDKPVGEIALDLGYTDASNFTRAFCREVGMAPQAFRESPEQGSFREGIDR